MPSFRGRPLDFVFDVRSKIEFFLGHLDGAEHIPVDRIVGELAGRAEVRKDARILVYCASGMRSAQAAAMLKQAGYTRVTDGGGMGAARQEYQAA